MIKSACFSFYTSSHLKLSKVPTTVHPICQNFCLLIVLVLLPRTACSQGMHQLWSTFQYTACTHLQPAHILMLQQQHACSSSTWRSACVTSCGRRSIQQRENLRPRRFRSQRLAIVMHMLLRMVLFDWQFYSVQCTIYGAHVFLQLTSCIDTCIYLSMYVSYSASM